MTKTATLPDDYVEFFAGNSTFFKHTDIPGGGLGVEMVVTIENVEPGTVGEGKDAKDQAILTFEGHAKKFGCNRTNCDTLATLYGRRPHGWIGKSIILFRDTTKNKQGQTVQCVRFRPYLPQSVNGARKQPAKKAIKKASKRSAA